MNRGVVFEAGIFCSEQSRKDSFWAIGEEEDRLFLLVRRSGEDGLMAGRMEAEDQPRTWRTLEPKSLVADRNPSNGADFGRSKHKVTKGLAG
jgi:hypothetical protein